MPPPRRCQLPAATMAAATVPGASVAQGAFPQRPILLIAPFPPGGGVDLTARLLAEPLSRDLGQPVVVENRGGAGGVIGVETMSRTAPDGCTLALTGTDTETWARVVRAGNIRIDSE
jgi:tripartite-type tricarboxylate transporter receptor subunit TctC